MTTVTVSPFPTLTESSRASLERLSPLVEELEEEKARL